LIEIANILICSAIIGTKEVIIVTNIPNTAMYIKIIPIPRGILYFSSLSTAGLKAAAKKSATKKIIITFFNTPNSITNANTAIIANVAFTTDLIEKIIFTFCIGCSIFFVIFFSSFSIFISSCLSI